ncbi:MAG: response regulator [Nitrospiraceae bacterium]|nr:MAG: response regulator [Nitrospiraceae bacterium]
MTERNNKPNVLVIDDAFCVRQSLHFILKDTFNVLMAPGALEGNFFLSTHNIDIVLLDIRLRGTDGLKLLADIKHKYPYIEIIMITAYASIDTTRQAIRYGAYDYLIKPFDKDELMSVVLKAMTRRQSRLSIKNELDMLNESTLYLEHLIRSAQETVMNSSESHMTAMLLNIDSRDGYTWSHVKRVTKLSLMIAEKMGLTDEQRQWLKCSASLHDIGKLNIDKDILTKESRLTKYEYEIMKKHPVEGEKIIQRIPFLGKAVPAIRHHHERYDGEGYPSGLQGREIPFKARILAVADAVDSMMNSPVRQSHCPVEKVNRELRSNSGSQFDPEIVDVVLRERLLSLV